MKNLRFLIALLALTLNTMFGSSREEFAIHYAVEDGLPSSECYHVIQDSKGFIWVATDRGVVRYDGYEFELFTTDNGLVDNVVFEIYEDYRGRVWFVSYSLRLCYYEENTIVPFPHNHAIEQLNRNKVKMSFAVDSSDNVYISTFNNNAFVIDSSGSVKDHSTVDNPLGYLKISEINGSLISEHVRNHAGDSIRQVWYNNEWFDLSENHQSYVRSLKWRKDQLIFNYYKNVYRLSDGKSIPIYNGDENVIHINQFKDQLAIAPISKGLLTGEINNGTFKVKENLLDGFSVSSVFIDKNEGIWLTTLENGVYYFKKHVALKALPLMENEFISHIAKGASNTFLLGSNKGRLFYSNDGLTTFVEFSTKGTYPIRQIKYIPQGDKFVIGAEQMYELQENVIRPLYEKEMVLAFEYLNEHELVAAKKGVLKGDTKALSLINSSLNGTVECVRSINDSVMLLGATDGVYRFNHKQNLLEKMQVPELEERVVQIEILDDLIVFATRGNGIVFFKDGNYNVLNELNGLVHNQINAIKKSSKGHLLVASHKGVSLIKQGGINSLEILNFTSRKGLISNEVLDVMFYDGNYYLMTKKGIQIIKESEFEKNEALISVQVKSIALGDSLLNASDSDLCVPHDKSFLNVRFTANDFCSQGRTPFRYRINDDGDWYYLQSNVLQFPFLTPGIYQFKIEAMNADGLWSKATVLPIIEVLPPFYKSSAFLLVSFLTLLLITVFIAYFQLKRQKEKASIKQQMITLSNQAMSSQMNPHFIFNSLNSIQNFILKKDKFESSNYLSKFAKLIRSILHNSSVLFLDLEEELKSLEIYLDLEKLRFKESVKYSFDIDKAIHPKGYQVPPMLIQPFIENAIWHGIMPSGRSGEIKVSMKLQQGAILCEVIDNGIGIEKSKEQRNKSSHQSFSLETTKKRLAIFHEEDPSLSNIKFEQLTNDKGEVCGTSVSFYLPYQKKKVL